jgi:DNA mismatch repair protein MutS
MSSDDRLTPARRQYLALKRRHPDALLLYRLGDFYELFDDDAIVAARDLHITLTSREFGRGTRVPMAGVPHHALASYLRRLLAKGHRVAIAEQLSEPGKGLVERDVVRVLSPGTVAEPGLLAARENNYLVALNPGRDGIGLAYVDVSTGEFGVTELGPGQDDALAAELARLNPAECLAPEDRPPAAPPPCPVTLCPARWARERPARDRLLRHFGVASLEPFGCTDLPLAIGAAATILAYVEGTNGNLLRLLRGLHTYSTAAFVAIDPHTRRNLELVRAARSGERAGSLLAVLDDTRTPMGGRLLRRWLSRPLRDVAAINARLDGVDALATAHERRARLRALLDRVADLERLSGRSRQGLATPRDLHALAEGLRAARELADLLRDATASAHATPEAGRGVAGALRRLAERIDAVPEVIDLIARAVSEEDGRLIRAGFDPDLDALLHTVATAQETLLAIERRERERTGIRSLKVGFNKVFGYYIEISHAALRRSRPPDGAAGGTATGGTPAHPAPGPLPADFVRRQTLAGGERFVTPELKEWEARILRAEERIAAREREVFAAVRDEVGAHVDRLLATAAALAELDVLTAFAELAARRRYTRPVLDGGDAILIEGGRHPVVETALEEGAFVPNDTRLTRDERLLLITGPNMAGKSTYLRQVALIVLLAHAGCFVPAERAHIGLVDRIFTRVGAQDDLAGGASTFLVEMLETAAILRHATDRSLLILDEIGRGTSTFDGLAIAQAVVEDVHDRLRARTLFATHFHELTALAARLPAMRTYNVAAVEEDGRVVFLRRVVPGGADRSYGIHVARLAGLPEHVTARAAALLAELEQGTGGADPFASPPTRAAAPDPARPPAAGSSCPTCAARRRELLLGHVAGLNLADTTPMQALTFLFALQQSMAAEVPCTCAAGAGRPRLTVVPWDGSRSAPP